VEETAILPGNLVNTARAAFNHTNSHVSPRKSPGVREWSGSRRARSPKSLVDNRLLGH